MKTIFALLLALVVAGCDNSPNNTQAPASNQQDYGGGTGMPNPDEKQK